VPESLRGNIHHQRHLFAEGLASAGFDRILEYEIEHAEFHEWLFYMAFPKDNDEEEKHLSSSSSSSLPRFYMNSAQFDLEIRKRSVRAVRHDFLTTSDDGVLPFIYFDGNQMEKYQLTTRYSQVVYCRRLPTPEGCQEHVFDPNVVEYDMSNFRIVDGSSKNSDDNEWNRDTVNDHYPQLYANTTIPSGSYILLEESVRDQVVIHNSSQRLINEMMIYLDSKTMKSTYNNVASFVQQYGRPVESLGENILRVETGPTMLFSTTNRCSEEDHRNPSSGLSSSSAKEREAAVSASAAAYNAALLRTASNFVETEETIQAGERI